MPTNEPIDVQATEVKPEPTKPANKPERKTEAPKDPTAPRAPTVPTRSQSALEIAEIFYGALAKAGLDTAVVLGFKAAIQKGITFKNLDQTLQIALMRFAIAGHDAGLRKSAQPIVKDDTSKKR